LVVHDSNALPIHDISDLESNASETSIPALLELADVEVDHECYRYVDSHSDTSVAPALPTANQHLLGCTSSAERTDPVEVSIRDSLAAVVNPFLQSIAAEVAKGLVMKKLIPERCASTSAFRTF
jgi:hypothetical protein